MSYSAPRELPMVVDAASLFQRVRKLKERLPRFDTNGPPASRTPLTPEEEDAAMALCAPRRKIPSE